ncbi:P-loop containing nucleoside triphosphate hydrolase protein [Caulochytrium protostelioides]|nr:P-loop containing nucleoside triphosphate hydrolase protein [Caulochytrium protostelioides]
MDRAPGHLSRAIVTETPATRIKLITLGNPGAGKSALVKQFCEGAFSSEYVATIGIDYGVKTLSLTAPVATAASSPTLVKVNFWDMAGDPVYQDVRNEFYRDTDGAIVVFDVCSKISFQAVDRWIAELRSYGDERVRLVLVGNKCESERRLISAEAASAKAEALGCR